MNRNQRTSPASFTLSFAFTASVLLFGGGLGGCEFVDDLDLSDPFEEDVSDDFAGPSDGGDVGAPDPGAGASADAANAPDPTPAPAPVPDVDVSLNSARIYVLVVGGSLSASVDADWSATGADDLTVEIQVLSSTTYRTWTTIGASLPPVYFANFSLPVTQGERRFDFRAVARDTAGNEWISDAYTIQ